jgi:hypothetical protein
LDGSQILNTNQLCLQPRRSSRKYSRPIVRPLYRKDVFYSGSIMHLITDTDSNLQQLQHQVRVLLLLLLLWTATAA